MLRPTRLVLVPMVMLAAATQRAGAIPPPDPTPSKERDYEIIAPSFRTMFGAGWRENGPDLAAGFAFDLQLGLLIGKDSGNGFMFWPELGYSYGGIAGRDSNLVSLGFGLHAGDLEATVGWTPRFIAGGLGDTTVLGVRNSLVGRWAMFSVELSHTWTHEPAGAQHELRFTVGLDLVWVFLGAIFFDTFGFLSSN
jgi:hypothetical protein